MSERWTNGKDGRTGGRRKDGQMDELNRKLNERTDRRRKREGSERWTDYRRTEEQAWGNAWVNLEQTILFPQDVQASILHCAESWTDRFTCSGFHPTVQLTPTNLNSRSQVHPRTQAARDTRRCCILAQGHHVLTSWSAPVIALRSLPGCGRRTGLEKGLLVRALCFMQKKVKFKDCLQQTSFPSPFFVPFQIMWWYLLRIVSLCWAFINEVKSKNSQGCHRMIWNGTTLKRRR